MSGDDGLKKRITKSTFGKNLVKALKKRPEETDSAPPRKEVQPGQDSFAGRLSESVKKSQPRSGDGSQSGAAATTPDGKQAARSGSDPSSCGAAGAGEHVVRQGDCISSIAKDTGHFWETLWNDPANAELRRAREDPNVLLPEDRVHVPPLREKWLGEQTEKRHRFRRRGETAVLRIRLIVDDVPLANAPHTLDVDGTVIEGTTDANGLVECRIPGNARRGRLVAGTEKKWTFNLDLGHINPVESLSGVQQRLNNLGFNCGPADGKWGSASAAALREFQKANGLAEIADPDQATRQRLVEAHGS